MIRKIHPYSFRSHVAVFLAIITVMSGLSSLIVSSLISRNTLTVEVRQSEYELAMTLLQLDKETELRTDELIPILERTNLQASFIAEDDPALDPVRDMLSDTEIVTFNSYQDIPVTCVHTSSGLVSIMPTGNFNIYTSAMTRVMSVCLFFMAIFLLASLVGSKHISHPVTELTDAMNRISKGDFDVRVPENGTGEVGALMRSFNRMTEALGRTSYVQKDFISSVSHEFKTPLASIKGYARLLNMPGLTDADRMEYTRMITTETDRLVRLSDTMLRLTALESQGKSTIQEPFFLDEQVRQIIVRMQAVWQEKKIDWDLDMQCVQICSDKALLEQVWTNLIQNAIKFSPENSRIHIRIWSEEDYAFFRIEDHGLGMTQEQMDHIYDRFYQADRSRSSEGVGLGLSLVHRILDILSGHISVKSEPGMGAVFLVSIAKHAAEDGGTDKDEKR